MTAALPSSIGGGASNQQKCLLLHARVYNWRVNILCVTNSGRCKSANKCLEPEGHIDINRYDSTLQLMRPYRFVIQMT